MKTKTKAVRARARDDSVRRHLRDGLINFSTGVNALPEKDQLAIIRRVRTLDDFADGNEFGSFTHNGRPICWKLDYLDAVLRIPRDSAETLRGRRAWCASCSRRNADPRALTS